MMPHVTLPKLLPGRSYLAVADDQSVLNELNAADHQDLLIADGTTLDVKSLRELVAHSQLTALEDVRLLVVRNAEFLSVVQQNTLLKLLEEPPGSLVIIIQTLTPGRLLPTVLSRLHPIHLTVTGQMTEKAVSFPSESGKLHEQLLSLPDRESLLTLLGQQLMLQREELLKNPNRQTIRRIDLLGGCMKRLEQNTNLKLTIDYLVLHWFDA